MDQETSIYISYDLDNQRVALFSEEGGQRKYIGSVESLVHCDDPLQAKTVIEHTSNLTSLIVQALKGSIMDMIFDAEQQND